MKRATIVLGSVIVVLALIVAGAIVWARTHQWAPADRTNDNASVNQLLTRADDWRRLVDQPVVPEKDMAVVDGSTATIPITAELLRQFYGYSDQAVREAGVVWHSTTHQAYVNLVGREPRADWAADGTEAAPVALILVTPPSEDELSLAADHGVTLDISPIAKDGFVFITHRNNPVDSLTAEQIRGIYTGEITNWSQVGGEDLGIIAYQREPNSGSQTAMEEMVMRGRTMTAPIETQVSWGMGALIDAVAEYDNGPASIGYTYNYYINNLYKNDDIKVLAVDGVSPTDDTMKEESYPFTTTYDAVIRADEPADSPARALRDFLLTEKGQAVVGMAGYCQVAP